MTRASETVDSSTGKTPAVVVFSSLFPSLCQPSAGLFVRERMFRVGAHLPLSVVAPNPWFPFQGVIRLWRPHFRPGAPTHERQSGIDVWFPRFLSLPGLLKRYDGIMMALSAYSRMRALRHAGRLDIIDAHFGYPDGYAAVLLGRWLGVPVTITMRGTEGRHAGDPILGPRLKRALENADRVFAVADALKQVAIKLGVPPNRVEVVGNGVDAERFKPHDLGSAREQLGLDAKAPVLISVGGLVPRKGFHRVIDLIPQLKPEFPRLTYLVVGGASAEGDMRTQLEAQVASLGLSDSVHFLGTLPPEKLAKVLSAANVFVLSTANEGWANVFLEAMACGLPVVTTDVGGNREVICHPFLGHIVPFGDDAAMRNAIAQSLLRHWDHAAIRRFAEENSWDARVVGLVAAFKAIYQSRMVSGRRG